MTVIPCDTAVTALQAHLRGTVPASIPVFLMKPSASNMQIESPPSDAGIAEQPLSVSMRGW